jgi:hypothetical protein
MTSGILPGNDFRVCNGQLNDSFNDGEAFAFHSTRIRQPFDFSGRTGTIVWDVDAKSVGHGWWTEMWVSDEPVPAPYQMAPGVASFPRNGFGIQVLGDFCPPNQTAIHDLFVVQNYQMSHDYQGGDINNVGCVATQDQVLNHFEFKVSQTHFELWGSDAGNPASLRRIASMDNITLPLTRGYVNFQHTHYNANKAGVSPSQTYRWDNVGFDGPVLAIPKAFGVPDSNTMNGSSKNVGYLLQNDGRTSLSLSLDGVDLTNVNSARLTFTVRYFVAGSLIRIRFNGGPWHDHPENYVAPTDSAHTESMAVPLSELVTGTNLIEMLGTSGYWPFVVANVGITTD